MENSTKRQKKIREAIERQRRKLDDLVGRKKNLTGLLLEGQRMDLLVEAFEESCKVL